MTTNSGMKDHSPSGHNSRPPTDLHGGMSNSSPSAVEPHPKGGSVDSEPTRSSVGAHAPTIGPRTA